MNKANMRLMWGKNLFFRKKRGKSGAFEIYNTNPFHFKHKKKPVKPFRVNGFRIRRDCNKDK